MFWQWNFGDGTANATIPNPIHPYATTGHYPVTLTVSNTLPSSNTTMKMVTVVAPPGPKFTDANSTTAIGSIHIGENGSQKVSLYLNSTPTGLYGYDLTVCFRNTTPPTPYVPNTLIANITDVGKPRWILYEDTIFQWRGRPLDGYNVTFRGVDLYDVIKPNEVDVQLANLTIQGNSRGNSTLHICSKNLLTDDMGNNINLTPPDYNLTVYVERLQPINNTMEPGVTAPGVPKDPNGDGLYEDVNGNNGYNFYDVLDFFNNLRWITNNYGPFTDDTNEYQPFFDFDQNGVINFGDVVRLFKYKP